MGRDWLAIFTLAVPCGMTGIAVVFAMLTLAVPCAATGTGCDAGFTTSTWEEGVLDCAWLEELHPRPKATAVSDIKTAHHCATSRIFI